MSSAIVNLSPEQTERIREEVKQTIRAFMEAYERRDDEAAGEALSFVHEDCHGYGSGEHEVITGLDDFRKIIAADFAASPEGMTLEVKFLAVTPLSADHAAASFRMDASVPAGDETIEMWVRYTLVCERGEDGRWRFIQGHLSVPNPEQAPGEALPVDALNARAERLEREVAERTRELEIETALERVRARAIGMQSSEEFFEVAVELREQMKALGQKDLETCAFHFYELGGEDFESWGAMRVPGEEELLRGKGYFPRKGVRVIEEAIRRYESDEDQYVIVNEGEKAAEFIELLAERAPAQHEAIVTSMEMGLIDSFRAYWSFADFSGGAIMIVTFAPADEDSLDLLKRAANAFDLGYKRFKDLREAEAAQREMEIEAALERVRAQAMSMQKPEDISDVSIRVFDELENLGVESLRSGITIPGDEDRYVFHAATKDEAGETTLVLGNESVHVHPIIERAYAGWREQEAHQVSILAGDDLVEYYHAVFDTMPLPDWKERMQQGNTVKEVFATFPFHDGWLYTFQREELDDDALELHERFARVFGLAYQRYHDLKQAERDYQALLQEKARTEEALTELQATQKQLIEQEKLASLGSLTAGIAHEIKNPLNFVNNFADVSEELMDELAAAVSAGDAEEADMVLSELRENARQIAKHGGRADSIVKSMMQHARGGASDRESVDVNVFLEEYASLAWHGMRAKDHDFQADLIRDLDPEAGALEVMPQDLGRVVLNLLNNAFDAVKQTDGARVTLGSRRASDSLTIMVSDNGPGIPEDIRQKIFEPFFTTKPTGEGTGLGLSLSYDIVTKGHGGSMTVGTGADGGAEFVVTLPTGA